MEGLGRRPNTIMQEVRSAPMSEARKKGSKRSASRAHAIEGKHVVDCLMVLVHVCQNSIHSGGVIVGQVSVHEGQKHVKDVGFVTVSKCIDVDGGMYVAERQPTVDGIDLHRCDGVKETR